MKRKKILYYFYNRFSDPLLQSNIFLYIHALARSGEYDVAIITYEDRHFPLNDADENNLREQLRSEGISWYPLKWHAGSNLLLKAIDLTTGFLKFKYLVSVKGYRHVISLGSIAGSFLYLFSKLARIRFYLYQYEPHSEYALDNKIWSRKSLQYRLLHRFEKRSVKACSVVSSGTDNMRRRLEAWKIKAPFYKVCSVANDAFFNFDAGVRLQTRNRLGINDAHKLVIYPGKLGELYCSAAQLIAVFKTLHRQDAHYRFLIISPNSRDVEQALKQEDNTLKAAITMIPPIPYEQMPHYLSAADLGIVAVLPGPSKQFISNIKVGEYLCSGLPYLICRGISEDDKIAETYHTGVVVEDLTEAEVTRAGEKIAQLLSEPKAGLAERCRKAGTACRGFEGQYQQFKLAVEQLTA